MTKLIFQLFILQPYKLKSIWNFCLYFNYWINRKASFIWQPSGLVMQHEEGLAAEIIEDLDPSSIR